MQPTFRQVPPRRPRFSIQAVYARSMNVSKGVKKKKKKKSRKAKSHSESVKTHLQTFLAGLDSSDVTSDTTTNDNHIVLCNI